MKFPMLTKRSENQTGIRERKYEIPWSIDIRGKRGKAMLMKPYDGYSKCRSGCMRYFDEGMQHVM
jgi:hypothetical protein